MTTSFDPLCFCDCCQAPMVRASHYGPDCSAGCETDACVLCSGLADSGFIEEEILELARHAADVRVGARLEKLSTVLDAAYKREGQ